MVNMRVLEDLLLQEDLIHMLPMVNEANAMSEELDKKVKFEVALIAPQARGLKDGRTEVFFQFSLCFLLNAVYGLQLY